MMTEKQINAEFDRLLGGDDFWWRKECEKSQSRRIQEQRSGGAFNPHNEQSVTEAFMATLP